MSILIIITSKNNLEKVIIQQLKSAFNINNLWIKNIYNKLGMVYIGKTLPNYNYLKNGKIYSRINFQKHKLKKFNYYSSDKTETEIMLENKYRKLYDIGNLKYIYKKDN